MKIEANEVFSSTIHPEQSIARKSSQHSEIIS